MSNTQAKQAQPMVDTIVGEFDSHDGAVEAVQSLKKGGFPMRQVSIIGKELEQIEDVKGYYSWKDPAKAGAGIGGFWGGLFGILVGVGFIMVPGIGGVFVAGSLAATLLAGAEGAALGSVSGGLFGSLLGLGISKESVLKYQEKIKAGKFLVVAHGSTDEAKKVRELLGQVQSQAVETH